jgi:hypothetical protein
MNNLTVMLIVIILDALVLAGITVIVIMLSVIRQAVILTIVAAPFDDGDNKTSYDEMTSRNVFFILVLQCVS